MDDNQTLRSSNLRSYSLLNMSILFVALVVFLTVGFIVGKSYQVPIVSKNYTNICPKTAEVTVDKSETIDKVTQTSDCEAMVYSNLNDLVKKEFLLGNYENFFYKLVWQEFEGFYNLRFKTPVMFVKVDNLGNESVKDYFIFTLDGGYFKLPCEKEITDNDYFPEVVKEYKNICGNLKVGEVFLTKSAGGTSAQFQYKVNLVNQSIEKL